MGWRGGHKRTSAAAAVATIFGMALSIYLFGLATNSAAVDIGLTLQRKQVLQSCLQDTSDRCGYLVFFSYQARPFLGDDEFGDDLPLRNVLPPQLAHMPFRPPRNGLHSTCSVEKLGEFVQRILLQSRQELFKGAFLFETPVEVASCFQTTATSFDDISFIVRDGTINGFVSCRPDYVGIALCDVGFARRIGGLDERIAISSFRREEITELLSNFPKFPENGGSQQEVSFLNALDWVRELLSSGVNNVKLEE